MNVPGPVPTSTKGDGGIERISRRTSAASASMSETVASTPSPFQYARAWPIVLFPSTAATVVILPGAWPLGAVFARHTKQSGRRNDGYASTSRATSTDRTARTRNPPQAADADRRRAGPIVVRGSSTETTPGGRRERAPIAYSGAAPVFGHLFTSPPGRPYFGAQSAIPIGLSVGWPDASLPESRGSCSAQDGEAGARERVIPHGLHKSTSGCHHQDVSAVGLDLDRDGGLHESGGCGRFT